MYAGICCGDTHLRRERPAVFLETAMCMSAMPGTRRFARWRQSPIEGPDTFETHRRRQTRHSSIHLPRLCAQSSQRRRSRRIPAVLFRRAAVRFEYSLLDPHTKTAEIKMLGYRYNHVEVLTTQDGPMITISHFCRVSCHPPALATGSRDSLYRLCQRTAFASRER